MAPPNAHIVKSFDDDLRALRSIIGEMGGLARSGLDRSIQSLLSFDMELAERVIADDRRIDDLEMEVEAFAISIIARRAPMAQDLREVIAALKIGALIERIGDYGKNISKRVASISDSKYRGAGSGVERMGQMVSEQVDDAMRAFLDRDPYLARAVNDQDEAIDDFYESLFQTLLGEIAEDSELTAPATHYIFIIKNLERIGDHATNIAEMVHYSATGEYLEARAKGGDATGLTLPL
ncbi:phosphate signaling complex protein PhoU [Pacificimonas sp. WHA3]|uniref:Phosphate-specific transport system accessory protein PhoU n=1 Tax=Pacificimonas pallii TaxID=2827236 RepID=A0ABS6SEG8_9SPHN|nr:phosphate signaling complex protein PhoU [Pacificimonas pallii]MBV7256805.1 phosphate signaling complex protein PhoU [Pacificimonas pallii]